MSDQESASPEEPVLAPYLIEPARSSRSKCKTCRRPISKDSLRLGVRIDGPFGPGYLWHHINCAARRQMERLEEAYRLQCWDQGVTPPSMDDLRKLVEKADRKKREQKSVPYTESAPSGRSHCKRCGQLIRKGDQRVALLRKVEFYGQVRHGPVLVHPECVLAEIGTDDSATDASTMAADLRANSLGVSPEDIEAVIARIGALPSSD